MKTLNITFFDNSEIIKVAEALANVESATITQGEDAVTTEDEVYERILMSIANHGIKCHDNRNFTDKLYNYEDEPNKERFYYPKNEILKAMILHADRERSTGDTVICVRLIFRQLCI